MNQYTPIIGLEVHVELKTKSKMFCSCSAEYFGKEPNTHTCPVCLGLPGALPVPNKQAIEWCIKIALALNCKINEFSKFDRKNYFYPDLAKGYQISQYDLPFGYEGYIELANKKRIGITRVHMEEDTAKLSHQEDSSLVDFNRSGIPLVEIVTEPDFNDALEVKEYLQKLQQIVRYLDVSNADMDKGEMRLEPNISLQVTSNMKQEKENVSHVTSRVLPNYKVEVKNINSFKFVEKAINYELKRQEEILEEGKTPAQETRGWNETKQKTFSQRSKEEAHDYRYFPEPDIPPIITTKSQISNLKSQMVELPEPKLERFQKQYELPHYDAEILTREIPLADYFEEVLHLDPTKPKSIANYIINKKIDITAVSPKKLIQQITASQQTVAIDEEKLEKTINEVLAKNPKPVEDYKSGKENALMFLLGQIMKKISVKVDTKIIIEHLKKKL